MRRDRGTTAVVSRALAAVLLALVAIHCGAQGKTAPLEAHFEHRPTPETCASDREPGIPGPPSGARTPNCVTDADCTDDSFVSGGFDGRCLDFQGSNLCSYDGCRTDDFCRGEKAVCVCGALDDGATRRSPHICTRGNECVVDSDCSAGSLCSRATFDQCGSLGAGVYHCRAVGRGCLSDAECAPGAHCTFDGDPIWSCVTPSRCGAG